MLPIFLLYKNTKFHKDLSERVMQIENSKPEFERIKKIVFCLFSVSVNLKIPIDFKRSFV